MNGDAEHSRSVEQAHKRGLAVCFVAIAAALVVTAWLAGLLGPSPAAVAQALSAPQIVEGEVPRPRQGLTLTAGNRGKVLFGRYCDSCHTAGLETPLGASLRSRQFKREFNSEAEIARIVREGGFDMPAYSKELLSDADLAEIAKYVVSLPLEEQ